MARSAEPAADSRLRPDYADDLAVLDLRRASASNMPAMGLAKTLIDCIIERSHSKCAWWDVKPCPKCRLPIAKGSTVCPHCHSSLAKRTFWQRVLDSKDYIALPTAVIALIVALADPIPRYLFPLIGWDGAWIRVYALNPDVVNIGLDDLEPGQKPLDEITEHLYFQRLLVANNGYSAAAIASTVTCAGPMTAWGKTKYIIDTIDIYTRKKLFNSVAAGGTITVALKGNSIDFLDKDDFELEEGSCLVPYADKNGLHLAAVTIGAGNIAVLFEE
jgi:hypothetical protein